MCTQIFGIDTYLEKYSIVYRRKKPMATSSETGLCNMQGGLVVVRPYYCKRNQLPALRFPRTYHAKPKQPSVNRQQGTLGGTTSSHCRLVPLVPEKRGTIRDRANSLLSCERSVRKTTGCFGRPPNLLQGSFNPRRGAEPQQTTSRKMDDADWRAAQPKLKTEFLCAP